MRTHIVVVVVVVSSRRRVLGNRLSPQTRHGPHSRPPLMLRVPYHQFGRGSTVITVTLEPPPLPSDGSSTDRTTTNVQTEYARLSLDGLEQHSLIPFIYIHRARYQRLKLPTLKPITLNLFGCIFLWQKETRSACLPPTTWWMLFSKSRNLFYF